VGDHAGSGNDRGTQSFLNVGFAVAAQAEFVVMIGDECLHLVQNRCGFGVSGILLLNMLSPVYCWLTTDCLVKRDHGPQARGAASFHATRRTLCDALVASEGRLCP
jgi:hypothetical protein